MATTLGELATLVKGQLHGGDPDAVIRGANPLVDAAADEITLADSADRLSQLDESAVAAVVLPDTIEHLPRLPAILAADAHSAFVTIITHFRPPCAAPRAVIHPTAWISLSARLADDVCVGPGATIGDEVTIRAGTSVHAGVHIGPSCRIGRDVTLHDGSVLYENTRIGDRVVVHSGAVLGAHGFGFREKEGRHILCPQLGYVEIGDDVEIGAATTIDRGTYGATKIGQGTKIDNLVQIAHNCRIGRHNIICAQVGIAGSTTTDDHVIMAGQVGVRDHVHIGERAVLSAMAGIMHDVPAGTIMMGIPATPQREQKLKQAALAKLAEMRREFKKVKRELAKLVEMLDDSEPQPRPSADRAA